MWKVLHDSPGSGPFSAKALSEWATITAYATDLWAIIGCIWLDNWWPPIPDTIDCCATVRNIWDAAGIVEGWKEKKHPMIIEA